MKGLLEHQSHQEEASKVIAQAPTDLRTEFPKMKGISQDPDLP